MFSANVCSGGLSDIGSHPHFMTKGRGDSTNSLETHVNLVQRLNKQSDICKTDKSANLKSKNVLLHLSTHSGADSCVSPVN